MFKGTYANQRMGKGCGRGGGGHKEGSKKDLKEDKKLAKKYGFSSLKKWEKSAKDKKHDKKK